MRKYDLILKRILQHHMKITTVALILALLAAASSSAFAQEAKDWRQVADSIPLGSKIKIHTLDGKRTNGTLMRVDDSAVTVKRNARVPEPAITVPFDRVSRIERDHGGGLTWAKAAVIGLGAGAGAMATIIAILIHLD